tara:strand:- start:853 stop:1266 length:414 start_codon:yes stop_codon:yes gene_type:complete
MLSLNRLKGLSILEVVVAAVLFLAFSIPLMSLLGTSKFTNKRQENRIQALMLAQGILEEINHNSEKFNSIYRRFSRLEISGFTSNIGYKPYSNNSDGLILVTVGIEWLNLNKKKKLEVRSLVSIKPPFYEFPKPKYQ